VNEVGILSHMTKKISSKWITDQNLRAKTIEFSEENIRQNLLYLRLGKAFLDMIPKAYETK
jgi:hypothetical protein